jgi:hypothetical protein
LVTGFRIWARWEVGYSRDNYYLRIRGIVVLTKKGDGREPVNLNQIGHADFQKSLGNCDQENLVDLGPLHARIRIEAEFMEVSEEALVRIVLADWLNGRKTRCAS